MHVPTSTYVSTNGQVPTDGNETRAGLNHPPTQQQRLAKQVAAVPVAQLVRLTTKVERCPDFRRRHQRDSPLTHRIEVANDLGVVELPTPGIELIE